MVQNLQRTHTVKYNPRTHIKFSKFLENVVAYKTRPQAHQLLPHIDLLEYVGASTVCPLRTQQHSV